LEPAAQFVYDPDDPGLMAVRNSPTRVKAALTPDQVVKIALTT
jgi:hypothetical protein